MSRLWKGGEIMDEREFILHYKIMDIKTYKFKFACGLKPKQSKWNSTIHPQIVNCKNCIRVMNKEV